MTKVCDFRDAVCLRYGWPLPHLPTECICGTSFNVNHAFTCPFGGYPSLRHNEIRDITAQLMAEVCPNVSTEPTLQPVTNERFFHRSHIKTSTTFSICRESQTYV